MARKKILVDTSTGQTFQPEHVVFGIVQQVTATDKSTKLTVKDIGGQKEQVLDLATLVGQVVVIQLTTVNLVDQDANGDDEDDEETGKLATELDLEV